MEKESEKEKEPVSLQKSASLPANIPSTIPFNRILSPIQHNNLNFLLLDCPSDLTINEYVKELKSRLVTDVVRVCLPSYNKQLFLDQNINVHDWPFKDGGLPPQTLINQFLQLCDDRFHGGICASKDDVARASSSSVIVLYLNIGCSLCRWSWSCTSSCSYSLNRIRYVSIRYYRVCSS